MVLNMTLILILLIAFSTMESFTDNTKSKIFMWIVTGAYTLFILYMLFEIITKSIPKV